MLHKCKKKRRGKAKKSEREEYENVGNWERGVREKKENARKRKTKDEGRTRERERRQIVEELESYLLRWLLSPELRYFFVSNILSSSKICRPVNVVRIFFRRGSPSAPVWGK